VAAGVPVRWLDGGAEVAFAVQITGDELGVEALESLRIETSNGFECVLDGAGGLQRLLALARDRPEAFAAALAVLRATPTSLPPVLPVVLYHGEEAWGRHRSVRDNVRLSPTSPLASLQPDGRYVLIDARRDEPQTPHRGPCVLLFAMLRSPDTPAVRRVAEELDGLLRRVEPAAPVAEDADPDDLLAQDGSLRGAFLLFILGLLRSRRYAAPYDVIQRVKGELPMITDTIDNVATVERQQGIAPAGPKNGTNGHSGR